MIREKYFNDHEVAMLKTLFVDDQEFVYLFRKLFFEEVSAAELKTLRAKVKDVPRALFERHFLAKVSADNPLGQHRDQYIEQLQIDGVDDHFVTRQIQSRDLFTSYFEERLDTLFGTKKVKTMLVDLRCDDPIKIKAYTLVVNFVDNTPIMVRRIAEGSANLSTEEIMRRQAQDSAK